MMAKRTCDWIYGEYLTEEIAYYYIIERNEIRDMRVVFQVQIPMSIEYAARHHKWSDYVKDTLSEDFRMLRRILPTYMQGICNEHNGLMRMSKFPNFNIGHIEYTHSAICVGGDNDSLQIAGCHPDDVGERFTMYFVDGLRGYWRGVNFTGCDNPSYKGDDDA